MIGGVGECYFQRFMLQQLIGLNGQCAADIEKRGWWLCGVQDGILEFGQIMRFWLVVSILELIPFYAIARVCAAAVIIDSA